MLLSCCCYFVLYYARSRSLSLCWWRFLLCEYFIIQYTFFSSSSSCFAHFVARSCFYYINRICEAFHWCWCLQKPYTHLYAYTLAPWYERLQNNCKCANGNSTANTSNEYFHWHLFFVASFFSPIFLHFSFVVLPLARLYLYVYYTTIYLFIYICVRNIALRTCNFSSNRWCSSYSYLTFLYHIYSKMCEMFLRVWCL